MINVCTILTLLPGKEGDFLDNAPPLHPEAMPENSVTLALNMESARKRAVGEAYAVAERTRPEVAYWPWRCPVVELVPLTLGTMALPIYHVVVYLEKPKGFMAKPERRDFDFQIEAASGQIVGMKDSGWIS